MQNALGKSLIFRLQNSNSGLPYVLGKGSANMFSVGERMCATKNSVVSLPVAMGIYFRDMTLKINL